MLSRNFGPRSEFLIVVLLLAPSATPAVAAPDAVLFCGVPAIDGAPVGDTWRIEVSGDTVHVSDSYGMDQAAQLDAPTTAGGITLRGFTVKTVTAPLHMVLTTGAKTASLIRSGSAGGAVMCYRADK